MKEFLVIGDSHSLFFGVSQADLQKYPTLAQFELKPEDIQKFPELSNYKFYGHYLGPVLAKSLTEKQSTLNAREEIFGILKQNKHIPNIIFAFGEIDCRFHIVKRLNIDRHTPVTEQVRDSIKATVLRYLSFCYEVKAMGFNVYLWAPIASNNLPKDYSPEYPNYGTQKIRNERTLVFREILKQFSEFPVLSIIDDLLDENGETKMQYYCDNTHINKEAWKFALCKLKELC